MNFKEEKAYNEYLNTIPTDVLIQQYDSIMKKIPELLASEPKEAKEQESRIRLFDTVYFDKNKSNPMCLISYDVWGNCRLIHVSSPTLSSQAHVSASRLSHYHIESC